MSSVSYFHNMRNGSNDWGVSFGRINWLGAALQTHENVSRVTRHDDIIFDIERKAGPALTVVCLDEYALGESAVQRIFQEFPTVNFISVGGNWNGYTPEAKDLCLSRHVGLYNSSEITGAIWKDEFWSYHTRDNKGNPSYPYKYA